MRVNGQREPPCFKNLHILIIPITGEAQPGRPPIYRMGARSRHATHLREQEGENGAPT